MKFPEFQRRQRRQERVNRAVQYVLGLAIFGGIGGLFCYAAGLL